MPCLRGRIVGMGAAAGELPPRLSGGRKCVAVLFISTSLIDYSETGGTVSGRMRHFSAETQTRWAGIKTASE